ncbi:hypothetical protein ACLI4U_19175 (plasmid) [Natrialbaceae archaeon A-CW2]
MFVCEHHESGDCLEIVESRIEFDENGELAFVEEHYECRYRNLSGTYRYANDIENIQGAIVSTDDRPRTILQAKREGIL